MAQHSKLGRGGAYGQKLRDALQGPYRQLDDLKAEALLQSLGHPTCGLWVALLAVLLNVDAR